MKTVWTPLGLKSLEKTTIYIEEQWNQNVADNLLDQLDERIEQLKRNPRIGSTFERTEYTLTRVSERVSLSPKLVFSPTCRFYGWLAGGFTC